MEATIDSGGRLLLPKAIRDSLGLTPGSKVDISAYGTGVQITPKGRTATVERDHGGAFGVSRRHARHRRGDVRADRFGAALTVRVAVDTSVAIPLLVASHEEHQTVRAWAEGRTLSLCGHAPTETYSVLTR